MVTFIGHKKLQQILFILNSTDMFINPYLVNSFSMSMEQKVND